MKLSAVIPAHNEAGCVAEAVEDLRSALREADIPYELVIVDDGSSDGTFEIIQRLAEGADDLVALRSPLPRGFGLAVRAGLERVTGDAVAIVMADGSDDPRELVLYYRVLEAGYDCAFGSRFMPGSRLEGYPPYKLVLNRVVNFGIRLLFQHGYNDTTNAFKAYKREVIDTVQPLLSKHFNLTVELPLKAITRGHSYAVVPISWRNRRAGRSKLDLREMGSRYLFIVLYVFLEAHLSRGDYRRSDWEQVSPKRDHRVRLLPRRGRRADQAGSTGPRAGGPTS
jgi:dolichol-phosphate mannosyltransferase